MSFLNRIKRQKPSELSESSNAPSEDSKARATSELLDRDASDRFFYVPQVYDEEEPEVKDVASMLEGLDWLDHDDDDSLASMHPPLKDAEREDAADVKSRDAKVAGSDDEKKSGSARTNQLKRPSLLAKKEEELSKDLASRFQKRDETQRLPKKKDKKSFTASVEEDRLIYLVRGVDQGKDAWYYVQVHNHRVLPLFLKAIEGGRPNLLEHSNILDCGWGKDPPEDIRLKYEDE